MALPAYTLLSGCGLVIFRLCAMIGLRRSEMRVKILYTLIAAVILSCAARNAEAGAIRYLGRKIKGGSRHVASATVKGGETAAAGVETAGKATVGAVETGAAATKNGGEAVVGGVAAAGTATGAAVKTGAMATKDGTVAVAHGAEE